MGRLNLSGAQARSRVLDLLPQGVQVYTSQSRTLNTLGLSAKINASSRYILLRSQADKMDYEQWMAR